MIKKFLSTANSSRSFSSGSIYELKSAMHIPLLVLGITPNSVRLTKHLTQTLKQFEGDEVEFFSDYTSYLDRTSLARDPLEEFYDEDDMAETKVPSKETLLEFATGINTNPALRELWSHKFAHKSQKQVMRIEPKRKLVHAIGIEDRTMNTYTYETLMISSDFEQ